MDAETHRAGLIGQTESWHFFPVRKYFRQREPARKKAKQGRNKQPQRNEIRWEDEREIMLDPSAGQNNL
jgi:hypothetical protein